MRDVALNRSYTAPLVTTGNATVNITIRQDDSEAAAEYLTRLAGESIARSLYASWLADPRQINASFTVKAEWG